MKLMKRNQTELWYCRFVKAEPIRDEYGNETSEQRSVYSEAVAIRAKISAAVGSVQIERFGTFEGYDKVILTDDMDCPIDENSVLFVDKKPEYDNAGNPLYDYQVKKVARSLNHIAYAIRKVTVS